MTHPLRVAENCTTHPLHKAQSLMTHPLSAPAHPPPFPILFDQSLSYLAKNLSHLKVSLGKLSTSRVYLGKKSVVWPQLGIIWQLIRRGATGKLEQPRPQGAFPWLSKSALGRGWNWRGNSNSREVVAISPYFSHPATREPRRACSRATIKSMEIIIVANSW